MSSDNRAQRAWTQGQVRETFVRGREQYADFRGVNISRAEFESWLAAHDAELERQIQGWVRSATEAKDAHRAEVEALRTRLAEAEAVIEKVHARATAESQVSVPWRGLDYDDGRNHSGEFILEILDSPPSAVLAEREREAAARAWDEGYGADWDMYTPRPNPYRSGSEGDNR
jgi:hypothetical protein